jgi:hypothetical protein
MVSGPAACQKRQTTLSRSKGGVSTVSHPRLLWTEKPLDSVTVLDGTGVHVASVSAVKGH